MLLRKLPADNVLHAMPADKSDGLARLKNSLESMLDDFLARRLPLRRIAFLASIFKIVDDECDQYKKVCQRILNEQKNDGGWVDCEDSTWNVYFLSGNPEHALNRKKAIQWLKSEKCKNEGWGFCKRDNSCIPITSQVLYLIPELRVSSAAKWLENEWARDLKAAVNLNYKGAWYLLAYTQMHDDFKMSEELLINTIKYLISEQRNDGGWGPWKNHPAPTSAFITGLTVLALSESLKIISLKSIATSFKKCVKWFKANQIENGLFPVHYIEEGSAWAYIGWRKIVDVL